MRVCGTVFHQDINHKLSHMQTVIIIIIIIIIERKDYGGVLSKTARTPNSFESACVGAPDQKLFIVHNC